MADTPTTPTAPPDATPAEQSGDLGDGGKKALDAERRARRDAEKIAADLDRQLKTLNDRDKSETERAVEARTAAEADRDAARAEAARLRIGLKHGLSLDDMDLLGSGTDDQIEERAARVAELRVAASASPVGQLPTRPVEQLRPGATPSAAPLNSDALENALRQKVGLPPI